MDMAKGRISDPPLRVFSCGEPAGRHLYGMSRRAACPGLLFGPEGNLHVVGHGNGSCGLPFFDAHCVGYRTSRRPVVRGFAYHRVRPDEEILVGVGIHGLQVVVRPVLDVPEVGGHDRERTAAGERTLTARDVALAFPVRFRVEQVRTRVEQPVGVQALWTYL